MAPSSEQPENFLTVVPDQQRVLLKVHLQPGAKSNAIVGRHGDALKIRIMAPAVDNKANAALVTYLGKLLGIAASHIHLRSGLHSRRKQVDITGATDQVVARLRAAIPTPPA